MALNATKQPAQELLVHAWERGANVAGVPSPTWRPDGGGGRARGAAVAGRGARTRRSHGRCRGRARGAAGWRRGARARRSLGRRWGARTRRCPGV